MKKFFSAWGVALFVITSICSGQNKPVTLAFNLATGESYNYATSMNITTTGNAAGQPIDVSSDITFGYHFTVAGDSSGWKKMAAVISKIALHINAGGMNINYDSDKPADSADIVSSTMGKVFGTLKDGRFSFVMNRKGDVSSITGIKEIVAKMTAASPGMGSMTPGLSNAFDEDNFKENIKQAFGLYPDKPVKVGDTWTSTINADKAGVLIKTDNAYTLESVKGNVANISVNSKISSPDTTTNISGAVTGTVEYDIPSGTAITGDLHTNMNLDVNAGGQSIPITVDIKTKITGNKP